MSSGGGGAVVLLAIAGIAALIVVAASAPTASVPGIGSTRAAARPAVLSPNQFPMSGHLETAVPIPLFHGESTYVPEVEGPPPAPSDFPFEGNRPIWR